MPTYKDELLKYLASLDANARADFIRDIGCHYCLVCGSEEGWKCTCRKDE